MNAHHRFSLTAQASPHPLEVLAFSGDEAISTPFSFAVEVVCERPDLDLETLLHTPAFLAFDTQGHGVHGQIYHVLKSSSGPRLTHYRLSLRMVSPCNPLTRRVNTACSTANRTCTLSSACVLKKAFTMSSDIPPTAIFYNSEMVRLRSPLRREPLPSSPITAWWRASRRCTVFA